MGAARTLTIVCVGSVLAASGSSLVAKGADRASSQPPDTYQPKLRPSEALQPFLPYLMPGGDAFPDEKEAAELAARLAELGARLREDPRRALDVPDFLLAGAFRGGRLLAVDEVAVSRNPSLQVFRASTMATDFVCSFSPSRKDECRLATIQSSRPSSSSS